MTWKFILITPENERWLLFSNNKEKLAIEKEREENYGSNAISAVRKMRLTQRRLSLRL